MGNTSRERHSIPPLPTPARMLSHGLPALIIGGALMLAVIWVATLELASMLARMQVEQRMALVAEKVGDVMKPRTSGEVSGETAMALAHLLRFLDVQHMELRDATGRVIWKGWTVKFPLMRSPAAGETVMERQVIDGDGHVIARHHARLETPGGTVHVIITADVSDIVAGYRRVGIMLAKAFSSVVLLAIFLMGWFIILRWREQRQLMRQIHALLQRATAKNETDEGRMEERAGRQLGQLLRQVEGENIAALRLALMQMKAVQARTGASPASGESDKAQTTSPARRNHAG